jgi:hypothetical protein
VHKFLLGLAIGVLLSQLSVPWLRHTVVLAQTKGKKPPQARIVGSGTLSGWSEVLFMVRDGQPIGGFQCRDPQVAMKYKTVTCSTDSQAIARGPILTGRSGALQGWGVNVSGQEDFDCHNPVVDFDNSSLTCPEQNDFRTLKAQLNQSRSDLETITNQISRPMPWTINVASVPPHGYACPAGVIDVDSGILSCPAIVPVF